MRKCWNNSSIGPTSYDSQPPRRRGVAGRKHTALYIRDLRRIKLIISKKDHQAAHQITTYNPLISTERGLGMVLGFIEN